MGIHCARTGGSHRPRLRLLHHQPVRQRLHHPERFPEPGPVPVCRLVGLQPGQSGTCVPGGNASLNKPAVTDVYWHQRGGGYGRVRTSKGNCMIFTAVNSICRLGCCHGGLRKEKKSPPMHPSMTSSISFCIGPFVFPGSLRDCMCYVLTPENHEGGADQGEPAAMVSSRRRCRATQADRPFSSPVRFFLKSTDRKHALVFLLNCPRLPPTSCEVPRSLLVPPSSWSILYPLCLCNGDGVGGPCGCLCCMSRHIVPTPKKGSSRR